jgi:hypothetical protein
MRAITNGMVEIKLSAHLKPRIDKRAVARDVVRAVAVVVVPLLGIASVQHRVQIAQAQLRNRLRERLVIDALERLHHLQPIKKAGMSTC